MSLYLRTICSGSDGNCTFVSDGSTHLLIDAGLSLRAVEEALRQININAAELSGILITHEHTDHVRGADTISARHDVPIYASHGTWAALEGRPIKKAALKNRIAFDSGGDFYINDFNIQPFSIPHDAADPVAFCMVNRGKKIIIATDMGYIKNDFIARARDANFMILESNYDPDMLRLSSYPSHLKARIAGRNGHLSNEDCAATLCEIIAGGSVRKVMLGHLSKNNNTPDIAIGTCRQALLQMGLHPDKDMALGVAPRSTPGALLKIS